MRSSPCFAMLWVAFGLLGVVVLLPTSLAQECTAIADPDFEYQVVPEPGFEIRWAVDSAAETVSFEVFSVEQGWVSVGFSADGMMIGSDCAIGLPEDSVVTEYELAGQLEALVVPFDTQELSGGFITQDSSGTTMSFTRPLFPTASGKQTLSATPGQEVWIVWAFGVSNELAYHGFEPSRGAFLVDLFCGGVDTTGSPAPTPINTEATTGSPTTLSPVSDGDMAAPSPATTMAPNGQGGLPDGDSTPSPMADISPSETEAPSMDAGQGTDATSSPNGTLAPTSSPTSAPAVGDGGLPTVGETPSPSTAVDRGITDTMAPTTTSTDGDRGVSASEAPTAAGGDGADQADAAYRLGGGEGGVWVAVATVCAAVIATVMLSS